MEAILQNQFNRYYAQSVLELRELSIILEEYIRNVLSKGQFSELKSLRTLSPLVHLDLHSSLFEVEVLLNSVLVKI